jgi:hypothetical protein
VNAEDDKEKFIELRNFDGFIAKLVEHPRLISLVGLPSFSGITRFLSSTVGFWRTSLPVDAGRHATLPGLSILPTPHQLYVSSAGSLTESEESDLPELVPLLQSPKPSFLRH